MRTELPANKREIKRRRIFYGWWIIGVLALLIFLVGGLAIYCFSVLLKPLMDQFNVGRGEISLIQSIFFLAGGVAGMTAGRLVHRYSPRKFIIGGAVSGGVVFLLCYFASSVWYLYAAYALLGIGFGGLSGPVPVAMITSKWFIKKRGMVFAISMIGGALGSFILVPLTGLIVDSLGWRWTYVFMGLLTLVTVPFLVLVLKDTPQEMGLAPDGDEPALNIPAGEIPKTDLSPDPSGLLAYLKNPSIWLLCVSFVLITMAEMAVVVHEVPYFTDINIPAVLAASALGVTGGIGIFGKFLCGWLSDRISTRYVLILFIIIKILGIMVLMRISNMGMVWMFVIVFGFSTGLSSTLMPVVILDIFGTAGVGVVFGFMNLVISIGCVLGPSLAGYIFDISGSYSSVFVIVVIMCLAALPATYLAYGVGPAPLKSPVRK